VRRHITITQATKDLRTAYAQASEGYLKRIPLFHVMPKACPRVVFCVRVLVHVIVFSLSLSLSLSLCHNLFLKCLIHAIDANAVTPTTA
jgi:hypothetical protein